MKELLYILRHPSDGFEDMKQKEGGSVKLSTASLLLFFVASVLARQYTAPRFNFYEAASANIFYIFISSALLIMFFVIANWSVTTLFDGTGTFKQIYIVVSYSVTVYSVALLSKVALSYVLTIEEMFWLNAVIFIGFLYTVVLIFMGLMTIHQFTGSKNTVSILISLAGVAILLFLGFLLISLFGQLFEFIRSLADELLNRSI